VCWWQHIARTFIFHSCCHLARETHAAVPLMCQWPLPTALLQDQDDPPTARQADANTTAKDTGPEERAGATHLGRLPGSPCLCTSGSSAGGCKDWLRRSKRKGVKGFARSSRVVQASRPLHLIGDLQDAAVWTGCRKPHAETQLHACCFSQLLLLLLLLARLSVPGMWYLLPILVYAALAYCAPPARLVT
jgi:hypothetical protein